MKTKEKFVDLDGTKFGILKEYDNSAYLERNQALRSQGLGKTNDSWCVGSIPMHVLSQWMKEEGISWDDSEGRKKLILKKLNDPDFKKLRIVEGRI